MGIEIRSKYNKNLLFRTDFGNCQAYSEGKMLNLVRHVLIILILTISLFLFIGLKAFASGGFSVDADLKVPFISLGKNPAEKSKKLKTPGFFQKSIPLTASEPSTLEAGQDISPLSDTEIKTEQNEMVLLPSVAIQHSSGLDKNTIVKVAITNNNFSSYLWTEVSILAMNDFLLIEKASGKELAKFLPADVVKIKINSGVLEVNLNGKIITKTSSTLVFTCPKEFLGIAGLNRKAKQAVYRGNFEIIPKNSTQFYVINEVELESYLKGVVPNEMPVRFGIEALKAQAIAARNYVLTKKSRSCKEFDVDDSVASQVYFGAGTEDSLSGRAVEETRGLVALCGWDLIAAHYSSTAGGYTENYENVFSDTKTKEFPSQPRPYLIGTPDIIGVLPLDNEEAARKFYMSSPDSYDMKSPYYRWQKVWDDVEDLKNILQKNLVTQSKTGFVKPEFKEGDILGNIKELKVLKRGVSGKIIELEIITDKQNYKIYKELVIRRLLTKDGKALPSANVVFDHTRGENGKILKITAYGGGYGHGVGMSQFGAGFMAVSLNKSFDKILKRYYQGITISTVPLILSDMEGQQAAMQKFYAPEQNAAVIVDNKYQIKQFSANINGKDITLELINNFMPIHRYSRVDVSSYIKRGENEIIFYFPQNCENKAIRVYVELIEQDESKYNF